MTCNNMHYCSIYNSILVVMYSKLANRKSGFIEHNDVSYKGGIRDHNRHVVNPLAFPDIDDKDDDHIAIIDDDQ